MSKLVLVALVFGLSVMTGQLGAGAAGSGGVRILLSCGSLAVGSGTFMVTSNGAGTAITIPCNGAATATNPQWAAGATALVSPVTQPAGTQLAIPSIKQVTLTAGVIQVAMTAVPIPSGGIQVTLTCQSGASGSATFTITDNEIPSAVTVGCGNTATVNNPGWTAFTRATIDLTSTPRQTYLCCTGTVFLSTTPVSNTERLYACPSGRVMIAGCDSHQTSGFLKWLMESQLRFTLASIIVTLTLICLLVVPFEFWIIRGWIRFFSRRQDPRLVIDDLSARPGLGWWVRRYVGWVRLKHRVLKTPLPPGIDEAA